MRGSICAVIPVYNHGETAVLAVDALIALDIPCIIVDDASDDSTARRLQLLEVQHNDVTLLRLELNQGKGGAVMSGLRLAHQQGFTHALQIDADGQHRIEDVPKMLAMVEKNPAALIVGQPAYDRSAPKGRMAARHITHFWVGVELLTFSPPDTMCGFRVYPLEPTIALIRSTRLGRRMDFDIEVMVRLMWKGTPIETVVTEVIYPPRGLSHFKYLSDNLLISWMHTKLFFGMLMRFPILLARKLREPENGQQSNKRSNRHWSEIQELGAATGIKFLLLVYRLFGRSVFKLFLYPITLYFFTSKRAARQASLKYLQKVYASGSEHRSLRSSPGLFASYKHFVEFGYSAIDRVASWTGGITQDEIIFERRDLFVELLTSGRGGLIIGAHLGNIELCRGLVSGALNHRIGSKMNILMFTEHAEKYNSIMKKVNKNVAERVIPVNQVGPDTAIMLQDKIKQGEIIVILGDRTAVNSQGRVNFVDFLGQKAAFAQGPLILANLLECPVYLMFCLKRSGKYHVFLESFAEQVTLSRASRQADLQDYIRQYAKRLEYYCKIEPFQWFNFYDYWAYNQTDS